MSEPALSAGDLDGRRVAVIGLGRSGAASARVLLEFGATVTVLDESQDSRYDAVAAELAAAGATVLRGESQIPTGVWLVVASPGLRDGHPMLTAAQAAGVEVIGEPALAWRLRPPGQTWLGVTGTNGKTTTVGMLAAILAAAGHRSTAAGNVGLPLVEAVRCDPPHTVLAVEASSAQLVQSPSIRFAAAAILNIAPDHLDWHGSFTAYRAAKLAIWTDAVAIGNLDDPVVAAALPHHAISFTLSERGGSFHVADGQLRSPDGETIVAVDELAVRGPHNVANALAAAAVAMTWGVPSAATRAGLISFEPGAHRSVVVAKSGGVFWVDDSKATNAHAAAAALAAWPSVVWIAGGLLKGADVDDLIREHAARFRAVVLLGRDRAVISAALARHAPQIPVVEVTETDTVAMAIAVAHARRLAQPGDAVLLAPAAASWDIFTDYAERGDLFAAAARAVTA